MRLVNDDRETSPAVLVADLVKDKGEFLKRCDDDLLSALDEPTQVARVLGVPHRGAHLGKLFDRIPDLPIKDAAVSDDDNGIEDGSAVPRKTDELVGQPSDGVGLATAGRMLDKIAPAHAVRPRVRQKFAHHVQLVVAREDLPSPFLASLRVFLHDELSVVFEDV